MDKKLQQQIVFNSPTDSIYMTPKWLLAGVFFFSFAAKEFCRINHPYTYLTTVAPRCDGFKTFVDSNSAQVVGGEPGIFSIHAIVHN